MFLYMVLFVVFKSVLCFYGYCDKEWIVCFIGDYEVYKCSVVFVYFLFVFMCGLGLYFCVIVFFGS